MPGMAHRKKLPYTQAVLNEIMRLGVVGPMALPHKALWDTTIGGYDVPKGTMVLVNLWALMHDPQHWDQPCMFRPERFLDEQGRLKATPKAYLPFSVGSRMCLGESVIRPELLLVFACFLKRFSFSLPEGATFHPASQVTSMFAHCPKPFKITVALR